MTTLLAHLDKITHLLPTVSELTVEAMSGGFSNQVYCLSWDNTPQLVIRVPGLDESAFAIHRFAEKRALLNAEKHYLTPPVMSFDDATGVLVSRFVPQTVFDWQIAHSSADVDRLAHCLQQIHRLEDNGADYVLDDIIRHYLGHARQQSALNRTFLDECDWLDVLATTYLQRIPPYTACLCHNDLNPKNCLADKMHFWVIDWEYAGVGDPLFDIAVVMVSHNLTEAQTRQLLAYYDEKLPPEQTLTTLKHYHILYLVREMAWLLLKHLTTPKDVESLQCYYEFKETLLQQQRYYANTLTEEVL